MNHIPIVSDHSARGERLLDIYSKLLKERIIFVDGTIEDDLSSRVVAQLLYLESESVEQDISLYINSPGGSVTAGLAIYDTIQYIKSSVATICIGQACSMGAFLLASGTPKKRYSLPNARIMIHQPLGRFQGQATDIEIHAKEILKVKDKISYLLSKHTMQETSKIKDDMERDNFMSPEKAVKYGIIDKVISRQY